MSVGLSPLPPFILNSGITAGSITAILLNLLLNGGGVSEAAPATVAETEVESTEVASPQLNID